MDQVRARYNPLAKPHHIHSASPPAAYKAKAGRNRDHVEVVVHDQTHYCYVWYVAAMTHGVILHRLQDRTQYCACGCSSATDRVVTAGHDSSLLIAYPSLANSTGTNSQVHL
jgi:hypothetical protein